MEVTDQLVAAAADYTEIGENLKTDCREAINKFKETMEGDNSTVKEGRM